jgi:ribosomal protein S7
MLLKLNLQKKLTGFINKEGNKKKSIGIINKSFYLISKKSKRFSTLLLITLFYKLNVFVEARNIKVRRRNYIIPFPINLGRRFYLIIKWLFKAINKNNKKIPISSKITKEFRLTLKNLYSSARFSRKKNNKLLQKNRSNTHFRW